MITGDALAAWLADKPAQAATAAGIQSVAARLRQLPSLAGVEEGLEHAQRAGPEAVLGLAERLVMRPDAVSEILDVLIAAAAADPYFRPHYRLALSEVHSGLLLFDQPALSLSLAVMNADAIAAKRAARQGGASLVFTGRPTVFHFIKGAGATLSFWEAPPIDHGFTARDSGLCRFVGHHRVQDGETLEVDGRRSTFVIEEAIDDLVFLQATTVVGAAPLTAEYDAETLRFIGATSTDEASSRTQMMLALLRTLDRQDAVPVFQEMLASEHFYARWQTMREFLALDAAAAHPHLCRMAAADPHPELREAAASTLLHFFPDASPSEREAA